MILKLEDDIFNNNSRYEYINSDRIFRIRITGKRIKLYTGFCTGVFVGRTEHNMNEIKKLDKRIKWDIE